MLKLLTFVFSIAMLISTSLEACTLFASSGDSVENGGTIIAKNRDFEPQNQKVCLVTSGKIPYYGLFSEDGKGKWSVKAGVNEKGLVVVSAMSSCIPGKQRHAMPSKPFMSNALKNYATVAEFLEHKNELLGPRFIMVADAEEIACIEVGAEGKLSITRKANGLLAHTNHYLASELQANNIRITESSLVRYDRIKALLQNSQKPLNLDHFIDMGQDMNDGPNNSIWRIGENSKTESLASFIVQVNKNKDFTLYLKYRTQIDMQGKEDIIILTKEEIFG